MRLTPEQTRLTTGYLLAQKSEEAYAYRDALKIELPIPMYDFEAVKMLALDLKDALTAASSRIAELEKDAEVGAFVRQRTKFAAQEVWILCDGFPLGSTRTTDTEITVCIFSATEKTDERFTAPTLDAAVSAAKESTDGK